MNRIKRKLTKAVASARKAGESVRAYEVLPGSCGAIYTVGCLDTAALGVPVNPHVLLGVSASLVDLFGGLEMPAMGSVEDDWAAVSEDFAIVGDDMAEAMRAEIERSVQ